MRWLFGIVVVLLLAGAPQPARAERGWFVGRLKTAWGKLFPVRLRNLRSATEQQTVVIQTAKVRGPKMLYLHGAGETTDSPALRRLAAAFTGSGLSLDVSSVPWQQNLRKLRSYIQQQPDSSLFIAGDGIGSDMALQLAARFPMKFRGALVTDPSAPTRASQAVPTLFLRPEPPLRDAPAEVHRQGLPTPPNVISLITPKGQTAFGPGDPAATTKETAVKGNAAVARWVHRFLEQPLAFAQEAKVLNNGLLRKRLREYYRSPAGKEKLAKSLYQPKGIAAELREALADSSPPEHREQVAWVLATLVAMRGSGAEGEAAAQRSLARMEEGLAKKQWRKYAIKSHHAFYTVPMPPPPGSRRKALVLRSSQPSEEDLTRLKAEAARDGIAPHELAIINLRHENNQEARFAKKLGLRSVYLDIVDHTNPTTEQIMSVLRTIADPSLKRVVVHCSFGKGRAGVMLAAMRIALDGWGVEKALREARQHGLHLDLQVFAIREFAKKWHAGELRWAP